MLCRSIQIPRGKGNVSLSLSLIQITRSWWTWWTWQTWSDPCDRINPFLSVWRPAARAASLMFEDPAPLLLFCPASTQKLQVGLNDLVHLICVPGSQCTRLIKMPVTYLQYVTSAYEGLHGREVFGVLPSFSR